MPNDKLRRQIAFEAARLIYVRQESQYYRAKMKAARRICQGWLPPGDLPDNREIRDQLQTLARMHSVEPPDEQAGDVSSEVPRRYDRFEVYRMLLEPLEGVKQKPEVHPEGDALYHSLQVFDLARDALPYDEEFQVAALLHDVGKAIDPHDHVAAALESLDGHITERTAWLIENHSNAGRLRDGTIGARLRRRLEASENFEELMLLCNCDRGGRKKGVAVPDVDEAIAHLRELARAGGEA